MVENGSEQINLTIPNETIDQETKTIEKEEKEYEKPSVTVDNVVFSKDLRYILLIKRGNEPFKDCYALPGGFMEPGESAEQAAKRELKEETHLDIKNTLLSNVYTKPGRDPRGWVISIAFYSLVDKKSVRTLKPGDDAIGLQWIEVAKASTTKLAFDHNKIILDAYEKARIK